MALMVWRQGACYSITLFGHETLTATSPSTFTGHHLSTLDGPPDHGEHVHGSHNADGRRILACLERRLQRHHRGPACSLGLPGEHRPPTRESPGPPIRAPSFRPPAIILREITTEPGGVAPRLPPEPHQLRTARALLAGPRGFPVPGGRRRDSRLLRTVDVHRVHFAALERRVPLRGERDLHAVTGGSFPCSRTAAGPGPV
jgi:hypothetical protein